MPTTDDALAKALSDATQAVGPIFEKNKKLIQAGLWPDGSEEVSNHQQIVTALLAQYPIAQDSTDRVFTTTSVSLKGQHTALKLIELAQEKGASEAIGWLKRLAATDETDVRIVREVFGIAVMKEVEFGNGVRLLPLSSLKDSEHAAALARAYAPSPGKPMLMSAAFGPPAAAVIEVKAVKARQLTDETAPPDPRLQVGERAIADVVRGLTLAADLTPLLSWGWHEPKNWDVAYAQLGLTRFGPLNEGPSDFIFGKELSDEAVKSANLYLSLSERVRGDYAIALDRLNLAKRRRKPGDQALDGCICLEAVLSDKGETTEIAHRVSVRAALLIGTTVEERRAVQKTVKSFYSLRSATVHGDRKKRDVGADRATSKGGLDVCIRILKTLFETNKPFIPSDLDLRA